MRQLKLEIVIRSVPSQGWFLIRWLHSIALHFNPFILLQEREIKNIFEKTTPKACSLDQTVICSSRGEVSSSDMSQNAAHLNTRNSAHETLGSSIQFAQSSEMKSVRNGSESGTGKMSAIQALLSSMEISKKQSFQNKRSTSLDLGICLIPLTNYHPMYFM